MYCVSSIASSVADVLYSENAVDGNSFAQLRVTMVCLGPLTHYWWEFRWIHLAVLNIGDC